MCVFIFSPVFKFSQKEKETEFYLMNMGIEEKLYYVMNSSIYEVPLTASLCTSK